MSRVSELATPYWIEGRKATYAFAGFVKERLAGTEDLRASGATTYTMRRFHALIQRFRR